MTDQEAVAIEKNVRLIVSQCHADPNLYSYSNKLFSVQAVRMDFSNAHVEAMETLQFYKLVNEPVGLLRMLYEAQSEQGKKIMLKECLKFMMSYECSAQVFAFLVRYHSFSSAISLLTTTPKSHFLLVAKMTLPALAQILRFDHAFISREDLEPLCPQLTSVIASQKPKGTLVNEGVRRTIRYSVEESTQLKKFEPVEKLVNHVCGQATRIQYLRLRKELQESANFEVNQDRDRLLHSLSSLGFSPRLTQFLQFAEGEFSKAQDAFTYKTCIDQIRSFFAELLNETAEKIAVGRGGTLAKANVDTKYPVKVRQYLEDTGFFSEQFRTLVDGLYRFMSDEGTHTLGATRDVARIARNIAVEIGLLITKRLQGT